MSQLSDHIIQNVDIVDVISRRVQLKRAGSNFSGLSPFQQEKTPSFMVSPAKQIFKDFSSGVGGNVITFVMEFEKIDYLDAVKLIAEEERVDISDYLKNPEKTKEFADEKEKLKRMHNLAQSFFVDALKTSDKAKAYLKENRKLDDETIEMFGIGYAPDSHYELIQFLKSKGFTDADILQGSLAKKGQSDIFSFFRHRITFPIYDTMGNIIAFSARVLDPKDQPKYLNSSEHKAFEKSKILYGLNLVKNNIKAHDKIIVVEGQMDVIALARLQTPIGAASCGTALTNQHIKLIKRYTEDMYLLFDNDQAGQNATLRALKTAYQDNIYPKIIDLPNNIKDVDDLANDQQGQETWNQCIKEAKDGFLVMTKRLKQNLDISTPVGKQKLMNTIFGLILSLDNAAMQEHYLQIFAEDLGLAYEILRPQYLQYARTDGKFELRKTQQKTEPKTYQPDREITLAALLYQNFLINYKKEQEEREHIANFLHELAKNLTNSPLHHAVNNNIDTDLQNNLSEAQLRREKELDGLNTEEKQLHMLKKTITHTIQDYMKQINKLSPEQRHTIMSLKKKISWK